MQQLTTYIKAGFSCIQLVTAEEERAVALIRRMAKKELVTTKRPEGYAVWTWTVAEGLKDEDGKMVKMETKLPAAGGAIDTKLVADDQGRTRDPTVMLSAFMKGNVDKRSIVMLLDFHMYLKQPNPMLFRLLKEAAWLGRRNNQHLLIVGCGVTMPSELEKEIKIIDLTLPTRDELKEVAVAVMGSVKKKGSTEAGEETKTGVADDVLDALSGLTTNEAADALSWSIASKKTVDVALLHSMKTDIIKRNGIVEVVEAREDMANVGGLSAVKAWLAKRIKALTPGAKKFGLARPRGILVIGISGTGKSLIAKAVSSMLGHPMLRLDGGKIYNALVGKSEENMRMALKTAEAMSPCVFFIDEIEKAMAGHESSGQTDSGTTSRVVGTFLQWMQDNTAPVFIVATANDITKLPPETLRRGRFDQIFFVDLPDLEDRMAVWNIHISRIGRKPKDYDIKALAESTADFTPAEIESIVSDGMFNAFHEDKEPTTETFSSAIKETIPLSSTMKERIHNLRRWANGRAINASGKPYETLTTSPGFDVQKLPVQAGKSA